MEIVNEPIISTSLNITGEKLLENITVSKLKAYFKNYQPVLFINTSQLPKQKLFKLVDIRDINRIIILRK